MGVDYTVERIYNEMIGKITSSQDVWKKLLRLNGQLYRYEFDNILMVYAQRPGAMLVADYDTWKKVGRYVRRGSKGIAIFPSRALKPYMRHVFDIGDTGGRSRELTWRLDGSNRRAVVDKLYQEKGTDSRGFYLTENAEKYAIRTFTKEKVQGIIKEELQRSIYRQWRSWQEPGGCRCRMRCGWSGTASSMPCIPGAGWRSRHRSRTSGP